MCLTAIVGFVLIAINHASAIFAGEITGGDRCLRLTVSCGLAEWHRQDTVEDLKRRADEALYAAKGQGRNCAVGRRRSHA